MIHPILVLDHQVEIVTMLRIVLQQQGFEVIVGRDADEGLRLLGKYTPALIISGLNLNFLNSVRHNPAWAAIPFIMMSNTPSHEQRWAAIEGGADAVLAKPLRSGELNTILSNLGVIPAQT